MHDEDEINELMLWWSLLASRGELERLKLELATDPGFVDSDDALWFALDTAVRQNDPVFVDALLALGAHIDGEADGFPPLWTAVSEGIAEMVVHLLQRGADPHASLVHGGTLLHEAAAHNHVDIAAVLIEAGVAVDEIDHDTENTSLMVAANHDHLEMVNFLLAKGANPRFRNSLGETPATVATKRCRRHLGTDVE